jgi:hypothetical protein
MNEFLQRKNGPASSSFSLFVNFVFFVVIFQSR